MKQVILLSSSKRQPLAHIASGYSHKPFKFLTLSGLQIVHVPAQSKYLIGFIQGYGMRCSFLSRLRPGHKRLHVFFSAEGLKDSEVLGCKNSHNL